MTDCIFIWFFFFHGSLIILVVCPLDKSSSCVCRDTQHATWGGLCCFSYSIYKNNVAVQRKRRPSLLFVCLVLFAIFKIKGNELDKGKAAVRQCFPLGLPHQTSYVMRCSYSRWFSAGTLQRKSCGSAFFWFIFRQNATKSGTTIQDARKITNKARLNTHTHTQHPQQEGKSFFLN